MACFDCAAEKTRGRLEDLAIVYLKIFKEYDK